MYINYVYNYDLSGGLYSTTVEYNLVDNTVGNVNDYQATVSNGCLTLNGDYYYFRTNTVFNSMKDLSQMVVGVSSENMNTGIHRVDTEGLAKLGIAPCDVRNTSDGVMYVAYEYSVEYADGNNFVVWDITAGTIFGFGYDEENVLTIVTRNDENTYGIESLVNAYIAQTGKQIRIKECSADIYDSVIRTKLMAEDMRLYSVKIQI